MDIDIDTTSIARMAARYAGAGPIVLDELRKSMDRSVLAVEASAKRVVPVKTGNLRRSITHEVRATGGGMVGKVGTNVPYAERVEKGRGPVVATRAKVLRFEINGQVIYRKRVGPAKGKPYLRPAITANRARIDREFAQVPKRVLQRLGAR